jgi:ATP-dependent DNA helicase RecG
MEPSPQAKFLTQVASLVVDVVVHAGELDERQMSPWLDDLRRHLAWSAGEARDLAVHAPDELSDIVAPLEALATDLDKVAHERRTLGGGWNEMRTAAASAIHRAREVRQRWIDKEIDEEFLVGLRDTVATTARKLAGLSSRLEEMDEQNRLDEIQSEASGHGLILLKAAAFGFGLDDNAGLAELSAIGRQLRDLETRTIYADGGQSVQRILDDVRGASTRLNEWVSRLLQ